MLLHASCAVRDGVGVLIKGPPGSGKSSLLLRLLNQGFDLVADDCVLFEDGLARAPGTVQGMIEVRGLGVYRRGFQPGARVGLVVEHGPQEERIATPRRCPDTGQPLVRLDLLAPGSADVVGLAVACLTGQVEQVAGPL